MTEGETAKEALERRIREARAKTSDLETKATERSELAELERKARFEENRARDLPHVQAAEDEHGKIRVVNTELGAVAVRRPHHLAFQQFSRKAGSDKGLNESDTWRLVKPCIVYPDVAKVEEIIEEYPGVAIKLANKVVELAQGEVEEFEGK